MHAVEKRAATFFGRVLFLQINSNLTTVSSRPVLNLGTRDTAVEQTGYTYASQDQILVLAFG